MSLSDANAWFGILGGAAGVIATLYVAIDSWRKGRKKRVDEASVVTTNAIQLMEQLRQHAKELEGQLDETTQRADDLTVKLADANARAATLQSAHDRVAEQLTNAQAEVRVLRGQVKYLTTELDRRGWSPDVEGKP